MKLGVVLYFGPSDNLASAMRQLQKLSSTPLLYYPLMQRRISSSERQTVTQELANWSSCLDTVLWWHLDITPDEMRMIRRITSPSIRHVIYNWDEPYRWRSQADWAQVVPLFDGVVMTCKDSAQRYRALGVRCWVAYPGYSTCSVSDNKNPMLLECIDKASFVLTNAYANVQVYPHQTINRSQCLSSLGGELVVYGVARSATGEWAEDRVISYEDSLFVFKHSALNACTHVTNQFAGYMNERVSNILGNGGLLWVDNVSGLEEFLIDGWSCVVMQQELLREQVAHVLRNRSYYDRVRSNGQFVAQQCLKWSKWLRTMRVALSGLPTSQHTGTLGIPEHDVATKLCRVKLLHHCFDMHVLDQTVYENASDEKKDLVSQCITRDAIWEPFQTLLVHLWLSANCTAPKSRFIDVGGHIGYYSLLASRVSKVPRVTYAERNTLYHTLFQRSRVSHDAIMALSCELPSPHDPLNLLLMDADETVGLVKIDVGGQEDQVMEYMKPLWPITAAIMVAISRHASKQNLMRQFSHLEQLGFCFYDLGCDAPLPKRADLFLTWRLALEESCVRFETAEGLLEALSSFAETNVFCTAKEFC
jgi:hypothetical protein